MNMYTRTCERCHLAAVFPFSDIRPATEPELDLCSRCTMRDDPDDDPITQWAREMIELAYAEGFSDGMSKGMDRTRGPVCGACVVEEPEPEDAA